jgi:3-dehydroquinate dehydratase-1
MTEFFRDFRLAAATATLEEEPLAREHADLLEFRMDLAENPLGQLAAYDGDLPLLVTNRAAWEGGEAGASERPQLDGDPGLDAERLATLREALTHDATVAVDVELGTIDAGHGEELMATAAEHDVETVVSTHDFAGCPTESALVETLERASSHGDVGKIAVTATDRGDVLALLSATHRLSGADAAVATMAMGQAGRHSRAVAPLYGSRIGYAPVDPDAATAPGQYDLATLRGLIDRLS